MPADAADGAVIVTNDQASICKHSAAHLGYYEDPFVRHFIKTPSRRTPVTNRGYYLRVSAIDAGLRAWVQGAAVPVQVVSLGAGFDTAVFRLAAAGVAPARYVELDLPPVIEKKRQILHSCPELAALLQQAECDYQIRPADLRDAHGLLAALEQAGVDPALPTLFVSEVVTAYVDGEAVAALDQALFERFNQIAFLILEPQSVAQDAFGEFMTAYFKSKRAPLRGLHRFPDGCSRAEWLLDCGCERASWGSIQSWWTHGISTEEQARVAALEPFDEAEEIHLKGQHYYVLWAHRGCEWFSSEWFGESEPAREPVQHHRPVCEHCVPAARAMAPAAVCMRWKFGHGAPTAEIGFWGHAVAQFGGTIWVHGGYGTNGRHSNRRLDSLLAWDGRGLKQVQLAEQDEQEACKPKARCMHSFTGVSHDTGLLFGGRMSPARPLGDSWLWRATEKRWEELTTDVGPAARFRHGAADVGGGALMMCGGRGRDEVVFSDCWLWNLEDGWRELECVEGGLVPRYDHTLTVEQKGHGEGCSVLLFGGLDERSSPCADLLRLKMNTDGSALSCEWVECVNPCSTRHAHAATVWREQLMIVGGVGATMVGQDELICLLDLNTLVWTAVAAVGLGVNPFWVNHAIVSEGDSLLILGGGAHCFAFGALFNELVSELQFTDFYVPTSLNTC